MEPMRWLILLLCPFALAIDGCDRPDDGKPRAVERATEAKAEITTPGGAGPLYLSIVVHVEEDVGRGGKPKPQVPDYDGDATLLRHFTASMRAFAATCEAHGAHVNFGTDWTFADAVAAHDPTFFEELEASGHEVDAHAHESAVSYHEVRERIRAAGGHPTAVASGLREDRFRTTLDALGRHPGEFQILWGIAAAGHGEGEDISGWVWRPSRDDWRKHDPDGAYLYIGGGELVASADAIRRAAADRRDDRVDTYSVLVSPRDFKAEPNTPGIPERWTAKPGRGGYWEDRVAWWDDLLGEVDAQVRDGSVQYATLSEVAAIFEQAEDALVFPAASEHPRSDRPWGARNREAGYRR